MREKAVTVTWSSPSSPVVGRSLLLIGAGYLMESAESGVIRLVVNQVSDARHNLGSTVAFTIMPDDEVVVQKGRVQVTFVRDGGRVIFLPVSFPEHEVLKPTQRLVAEDV